MMKEQEIRKRDIFNQYLQLTEEDCRRFFTEKSSFVYLNCPACGGSDLIPEFEKNNFQYVSCRDCLTLFANPRPSFAKLKEFYSDSVSARFWVNEFFMPVAELRREKIFKPRAEYADKVLPKKEDQVIGDVGAGVGIFLEELKRLRPKARLIAIEPSSEQAEICSKKGLEVRCSSLEEIKDSKEQFDVLTAFELLEHLFDPGYFLNYLNSLLMPGGHLLMTTLNGQGFDIKLLWERSKSVNPPHHINFLNPSSLLLLLKKCGFEIVEISTPGRLDWDIVEGMIRNEGVRLDRWWNSLAFRGTEGSKEELQEWIARNNLSSHMRVIAKKI